MGTDDKIDAKSDQLKGKAKEGVGRATDDRDLEAEGHATRPRATTSRPAKRSRTSSRADADLRRRGPDHTVGAPSVVPVSTRAPPARCGRAPPGRGPGSAPPSRP